MRRLLLAGCVLGLALGASPAPAASVTRSTSISVNASKSNLNNSGFSIMGSVYHEETVGGTSTDIAWFSVGVSDGIGGFASESGPLNVSLDPLLMTGSITGVLGSITVDLTFLASRVALEAPHGSIELVPTAPQEVTLTDGFARGGRVSGTVSSSATGSIPGVNGPASVSRYDTLLVAA